MPKKNVTTKFPNMHQLWAFAEAIKSRSIEVLYKIALPGTTPLLSADRFSKDALTSASGELAAERD